LLASEATDLELELLDTIRKTIKTSIGDCFIDDAFKVTKLSNTSILVAPGEAWLEGLPFSMRSAKDPLVSGSTLSLGIAPAGTSIADDSTGLGKVITFTTGLTPSSTYDIYLSAQSLVTNDSDVPFLRNQNLTEPTAQKIRIEYRINIVDHSSQHDFVTTPYNTSATLYGDENSAVPVYNLFNEYSITPDSVTTNGTIYSITNLTPSQLDGSNLEVILWNINNPGGSVYAPLPIGAISDQLAYYNGTLIDSYGSSYHIVSLSLYSISGSNDGIRLVLDKEIGNSLSQPNPQIVNGVPFKIIKRDLCYGDSGSNLLGKRHYVVASVIWDTTNGVAHNSTIIDLRNNILSSSNFQNTFYNRIGLSIMGGGTRNFTPATQIVSWTAAFTLISARLPQQTIALSAGTPIVDGGALLYELSTVGGAIERGTQAVTTTTTGTSISLSGSPNLANIKLGNIIQRGADVATITAIDDVADVLVVTPALSTFGAATIYLDSYGPIAGTGVYLVTPNTYLLASRKGTQVIFYNLPEAALVDGSSIDYNGSGQLEVKASGIQGPMLNPNTVDNFTIQINGSSKLTNSNSYFGNYATDAAYVVAKGVAAIAGDSYFNTTFKEIRHYTGTIWRGSVPTGTLFPYAGITAPDGYYLCDGASKSTTDPLYANLFAVIGYAYGGSGGNFNLPVTAGRTVIGAGTYSDPVSGSVTRTRGQQVGAEAHQLTSGQSGVPSHSHPRTLSEGDWPAHKHGYVHVSGYKSANDGGSGYFEMTGLDNNYTDGPDHLHYHYITVDPNTALGAVNTHNNMQPSLGANYIIKL
jgi:microcystin-dependent protein